jgi:hypothetical protein
MNWSIARVKQLIKEEADADIIMEETGIKRSPLQAIVALMNQRDQRFYNIQGLFKPSDT